MNQVRQNNVNFLQFTYFIFWHNILTYTKLALSGKQNLFGGSIDCLFNKQSTLPPFSEEHRKLKPAERSINFIGWEISGQVPQVTGTFVQVTVFSIKRGLNFFKFQSMSILAIHCNRHKETVSISMQRKCPIALGSWILLSAREFCSQLACRWASGVV